MTRCTVSRAVAKFFCKGGGAVASAEGTSLVGDLGVSSPRKFSETLFSALVLRYVSEKSTSNKCEKAGVFSAYNIISDVLLI